MNNFTTNTYEMKREIIIFSNKPKFQVETGICNKKV